MTDRNPIGNITPYGYHYVSMYLEGSNVRSIRVLVCDDDGCLVADFQKHEEFHRKIGHPKTK